MSSGSSVAPARVEHLVVLDAPDVADFAPLSLTRPVFALRCGVATLLQTQLRAHAPQRLSLWVRPALEGGAQKLAAEAGSRFGIQVRVNEPLDATPAVLLDGRTWWPSPAPPLQGTETDESGLPLRWRLSSAGLTPAAFFADRGAAMGEGPPHRAPCTLMRRPWDLIARNAAAMGAEAARFSQEVGANGSRRFQGVHLLNHDAIFIAPDVSLEPGCVLDARGGLICLDAGAQVGANASLRGPCYVGRGSILAPLARLNPGANIGPMCKIGGEVGNVIFHGLSNKAHDGYLGDSYVGEWVNLGAGTTTSNLKNTYGPIRAATPRGREDTGLQFLGTIFGDHAKCGIGTMLEAGSYVGVASQIAVPRPPQFVRSFRFLTREGEAEVELAKLSEAAARVTARRGTEWSLDDAALLEEARLAAAAIER